MSRSVDSPVWGEWYSIFTARPESMASRIFWKVFSPVREYPMFLTDTISPSCATLRGISPVERESTCSRKDFIRFFMPARHTLETLPVPDDPRVTMAVVPAETVAVLRFSGVPRAEAVAQNSAALAAALKVAPWVPAGPVQAWFYDPPWTVPAQRRNEVAVPVARR